MPLTALLFLNISIMIHVIATDTTYLGPGVKVTGYNLTDRQEAANSDGDQGSSTTAVASAVARPSHSFSSLQQETNEEKSQGNDKPTAKQLKRKIAQERDKAAEDALEDQASARPATAPRPHSDYAKEGYARPDSVLAQIASNAAKTSSASKADTRASRPFMNNEAVETAIRTKCVSLALHIKDLREEKNKHLGNSEYRQGFSCAEAHALALYCITPNKHFNLLTVQFSPPSEEGLSIPPCKNCQMWLEPISPQPSTWWKIKRELLPRSGPSSPSPASKPTQVASKPWAGWNNSGQNPIDSKKK